MASNVSMQAKVDGRGALSGWYSQVCCGCCESGVVGHWQGWLHSYNQGLGSWSGPTTSNPGFFLSIPEKNRKMDKQYEAREKEKQFALILIISLL